MSTDPFEDLIAELDNPQAIALPGYEVLGLLGRGGHARVFLARRLEDGELVAVKRWLSPPRQPLPRARIEREARALRALAHPGIARFYELTEDGQGRPCLVMEFINGPSLAQRLGQSGPLPATAALSLLIELLDAIKASHAKGLIHRDIKASNVIMRREDDRPVLVDFSIVKQDQPEVDNGELTRTDQHPGTLGAMAPEQFGAELKGRPLTIDRRTDIYGLGALLFQTLTGRLPWSSESPWERLSRNPWRDPHPNDGARRRELEAIKERTPAAVGRLVARCLEGRPSRRFKDARALERAARKALRPSSFPAARAAIIALLLLLGVAVLGAALWRHSRGHHPSDRPEAALAPTDRDTDDQKGRDAMNTPRLTAALAALTSLALSEAPAQDAAPPSAIPRPQEYAPLKPGQRQSYRWRLVAVGFPGPSKRMSRKLEAGDEPGVIVARWSKPGLQSYLAARFPDERLRRTRRGLVSLGPEGQERLRLPFPLKIGQRWGQDEQIKLAGLTALRLPSGALLEACLKVVSPVSTARGNGTMTDIYARGKGLVKRVIDISNGFTSAQLIVELVDFKPGGDTYLDVVDHAAELLAENHTAEALTALGRAHLLAPKRPEALALRAEIYTKLKRFDRAVQDWSRVLDLDPKDLYARERRALLLAIGGELKAAKSEYDRLVQAEAKEPRHLIERAIVQAKMNDYTAALRDLDRAIALDPAKLKARWTRAAVLEAAKQTRAAIGAYGEVIVLAARGEEALAAEARFRRGLCFQRLGEAAAAREDLEAFLRAARDLPRLTRAREEARRILSAKERQAH